MQIFEEVEILRLSEQREATCCVCKPELATAVETPGCLLVRLGPAASRVVRVSHS